MLSTAESPVVTDCLLEKNFISRSVSPPVSDESEDAQRKSSPQHSIDLTQPYGSAFPSPPTCDRYKWGTLTPHTQASRAIDSFPFPLQPTRLLDFDAKKSIESSNRRSRSRPSSYLTPPNSPDRFVPNRRSPGSSAKSFQFGKPTRELSDTERLLRDDSASIDPFNDPSGSRIDIGEDYSKNALEASYAFTRQRQVSVGAVWNVGGIAPSEPGLITATSDGHGGTSGRRINVPSFSADFFGLRTELQTSKRFKSRVAAALNVDQTSRILRSSQSPERGRSVRSGSIKNSGNSQSSEGSRTRWKDGKWISDQSFGKVPRELGAPDLRDDFYCSVLAYCSTSQTLAVALGNLVYLWSEDTGVRSKLMENATPDSHVTSLSFSSAQGARSILAIGHSDGAVNLWSLFDQEDRFHLQNPTASVACLSFKPMTTQKTSDQRGVMTATEELLIGDELGYVRYYSIEWLDDEEIQDYGYYGSIEYLAKVSVHTQQICGLTWSPSGDCFATGGNDNLCCVFDVQDTLETPWPIEDFQSRSRHTWAHEAAVKAIAFCPWQSDLIATGGGSNDRAIHFYHTGSGACLATITVHAQVTTLIWSKDRREIAATFGFAQPDHPYRVAIFSWPDCKQVAAIPWENDFRALYAIPYSGGPHDQSRRTREDSLIVAASDETVKFFEVWSDLGGSDILESLEGFDREGTNIIR